ncbi:MAG: hypothetical protein K1W39_18165 [Lachnospiraceae bacterium]
MCNNCYEHFSKRSNKIMLFCKLKEHEKTSNEMLKLCICQRFCNDKDKYIPYNQKEGCRYYKN